MIFCISLVVFFVALAIKMHALAVSTLPFMLIGILVMYYGSRPPKKK